MGRRPSVAGTAARAGPPPGRTSPTTGRSAPETPRTPAPGARHAVRLLPAISPDPHPPHETHPPSRCRGTLPHAARRPGPDPLRELDREPGALRSELGQRGARRRDPGRAEWRLGGRALHDREAGLPVRDLHARHAVGRLELVARADPEPRAVSRRDERAAPRGGGRVAERRVGGRRGLRRRGRALRRRKGPRGALRRQLVEGRARSRSRTRSVASRRSRTRASRARAPRAASR